MRKLLLTTIAIISVAVSFIGCEKKEPLKFDYPIEEIYGKWRITHIKMENGTMVDITNPLVEAKIEPTYAIFKSDGSYYGYGYFGNGSGTYTAQGKTITCYVGGKVYLKYDVISFSGGQCDLKMYAGGDASIYIRCQKQ